MSVLTRTLTFTPGPDVQREAITRTNAQGVAGFQHQLSLTPRPYYRFTLHLEPLARVEAECLSALHAYHQGAQTIMWDGGPWGGPRDYTTFAYTDGTGKRSYFLPHRNLLNESSFSLRSYRPATGATSVWPPAAYQLFEVPGLVYLGTSPASGDELQAKYLATYRVMFPPDGLALREINQDLYSADLVLVENPSPIPDPALHLPDVFFVSLAATARTAARTTERVPIQRVTLRPAMHLTANVVKSVTGSTHFGTLAVASGATGATITTGFTDSTMATLVPYWNTTWWVTSRSVSLVNVGFGTQVSSGGSFIDWGTVT